MLGSNNRKTLFLSRLIESLDCIIERLYLSEGSYKDSTNHRKTLQIIERLFPSQRGEVTGVLLEFEKLEDLRVPRLQVDGKGPGPLSGTLHDMVAGSSIGGSVTLVPGALAR